jgi:hypothetical protein
MPCQWSHSSPCPFSAASDQFIEFQGRDYCPVHVPLDSPEKENADAFAKRFQELQQKGYTNFSWATFPGTIAPNRERYDARRNLDLTHCTFGDRCEIVLNDAEVDMSGSRCLGDCVINVVPNGPHGLKCNSATFEGDLAVEAGAQAGTLDFENSQFLATTKFQLIEQMRSLNFANCHFTRAPSFGRSVALPQRTTFRAAKFNMLSEDEGAYRSIRNYFNMLRNRDAEGLFYAREKRCHRLGMTQPREWVPRAISYLYDLTSEYGYSYGWALFWFFVAQVVSGLTYARLSHRLFNWGGTFDSRVVAFTFAQVVKPFELFSSKIASSGAYAIVPDPVTGWWLLLTAVQSVLSITLLALFLLAIRWRFRRE